ncbi:MAG: 5-(carboxyamino)imidazole ribonucleotide synthase [Rhodoferax sp.]
MSAGGRGPLLPSTREVTLGVLGGGQLGRMFVQAAQRMGYFTAVLDPDANSPAGRVSHHHLCADYTDAQALQRLGELAQAVSTEFENVPAQALQALAAQVPVAPAASAVAIAQDRAQEKAHFVRCGVPVAPHALIDSADALARVVAEHSAATPRAAAGGVQALGLLPGILKTARLGYDGKGQATVRDGAELAQAWERMGRVPCVLEKRLPLALECSVIVARGADGTCVHLPVQRNLHRGGILAVTEVYEGNLPPALVERAVDAAKSIANGLRYVGVLCVEFFVLDAASPEAAALGGLVVNEMAPRPHNSGHYSIEACDVSQFELQVRTLARLPLTQPRQHSPAFMLNLLGDLWPVQGEPDWAALLALPGTHLHLYGKAKAAPGRKMGHLTITAATVEQARAVALQAARLLGMAPF